MTLATMVPGGELLGIPPFGWTVSFVGTMPLTGGGVALMTADAMLAVV